MNVLVVADGHYLKDKYGNVYAESVYNYAFYERYLSVFDKVYAIVRLEEVGVAPTTAKLCSGPNVEFLPLPTYRGPIQYAQKYLEIKRVAAKYFDKVSCAVFRIPAATSNLLCKMFAKTGKPYVVEVVVDPWEFFAKGSVTSLTRPLVRIVWTNFVKSACKKANGVSYVTEYYLQKRYPASAKAFQSHYSSVEIPADSLKEPRVYVEKNQYMISHCAAGFATYGKGHIQLMNAVAKLRKRGMDISITFIGDGPLRTVFEQHANDIGIKDNVVFAGLMPSGAEVRKVIELSDIFVFPTKAEGLPRVLLEAMASAMPCISTPVCGIPEILDEDFLVAYDDVDKLAYAIKKVVTNPETMTKASKDNVSTAAKYTSDLLQERRVKFYKKLAEIV